MWFCVRARNLELSRSPEKMREDAYCCLVEVAWAVHTRAGAHERVSADLIRGQLATNRADQYKASSNDGEKQHIHPRT